mmetsp:Transcript_9517/g.17300  ORF Transcript_9517/g.17300 Transcript_9517/m.17300 type:complete len:175 (+) Transcript_9517:27-551(+)
MTPPSSSRSSSTRTACQDLSFCILWSPLPPITWIIPFIGHTGIANSRGIASDFQGPYFVGDSGRMAFGPPTRALRIDLEKSNLTSQQWDDAIEEANQVYRGRMHNICCDNCHSHVSNALNRMPMEAYGISKWDMVKLCFLIFFRARFLSFGGFLCQFGPFLVVVLIIVLTTILK